jgi:YegS/Rv2252/BmrU family lipid kinase
VVLFNPSAGAGRAGDRLPSIEAALAAEGLEYRIVRTSGLDHGVAEATSAAAAGSVPIVVSGDGLIGAVGGALAESETPLAVVPGGRGNDFARAMGIPIDPGEAVRVIAAGATRTIDVGQANDRRFLCIASLGFDSEANRIANEAKLIRGRLVYAYAGTRALAAWKPAKFDVRIDGVFHDFSGYSVAVGNCPYYGGGMKMAPDAQPDDGLLDVVMTHETGKLAFFRGLPEVFKGEHVRRPEVVRARGARVAIDADRPFDVYADGECITRTPVTVTLLPGALRVCVPAP